jgi:hypothetical protein
MKFDDLQAIKRLFGDSVLHDSIMPISSKALAAIE